MKATTWMVAAVLVGGTVLMLGSDPGREMGAARKRNADLQAQQRELALRHARDAEARGDLRVAAFFREMAMTVIGHQRRLRTVVAE